MKYEKRAKLIGARIKSERERHKISQEGLLVKISRSYKSTKMLRDWENGIKLPGLNDLANMAALFSCDVGYLLGDYDQRTRDASDLCQLTGLSEAAASSLLSMCHEDSRYLYSGYLKELNFMLESVNFRNAIGYMVQYRKLLHKTMQFQEIRKQQIQEQGSAYTYDPVLGNDITSHIKDTDLNHFMGSQHFGYLFDEIKDIEEEVIKNGKHSGT